MDFKQADLTKNPLFSLPAAARRELPATTRKSFYGKAYVIRDAAGVGLVSYEKPIMVITPDDNIIVDKTYFDWSATTHRHELAFLINVLSSGYWSSKGHKTETELANEAKKILHEIKQAT